VLGYQSAIVFVGKLTHRVVEFDLLQIATYRLQSGWAAR
jgi:hypothetical protein